MHTSTVKLQMATANAAASGFRVGSALSSPRRTTLTAIVLLCKRGGNAARAALPGYAKQQEGWAHAMLQEAL
jgi:hypothetical protein